MENANPANDDFTHPESAHFVAGDGETPDQAWEEVAEGRFMPKRVRGSCHGRALG